MSIARFPGNEIISLVVRGSRRRGARRADGYRPG
jgi:hypothetical protein